MDVFFETQSGSTFSIEVGYWDTVLEIKKKIEKYQGVPVSKQNLFFQGNCLLQDDLDIEQCKIFHNSRLQVFVSPFRNLNHNSDQVLQNENSPQPNSTEQIINDQDLPAQLLQTEKSQPSNSVKDIINIQDSPVKEIKVGSNNNNDQVLQTEKSPPSNSVKETVNIQGSSVKVRSNKKSPERMKVGSNNNKNQVLQTKQSPPSNTVDTIMDVFFETQSGSKFSIEVDYMDTVLDIKRKIEKYQGVPVSKQTLFFQGNCLLQDDLDIQQCKIFHNSRLQVFVSPFRNPNHNSDQVLQAKKPPQLHSAEHIINDQDFPVTAKTLQTEQSPPSHSVREIKSIQESPVKVGSNNKSNQVLHQTKQSPPSKSIKETINIPDSPWKPVKVQIVPMRMTVFVLPYSGESKAETTIPMDVNPRDNVEELRKALVKIQQSGQLNLPQEGYFFLHRQSKMVEDQTFWSNGVKPGDTIEISLGHVKLESPLSL